MCRIKGVSPFSYGKRLRLQLWLPDQLEPAAVEQAVVRWIKDDQFGVSILEMSADDRTRLAQIFQVLQAAQQPTAHVIPVTVVTNTEQDAALPSPKVRAGRFDR